MMKNLLALATSAAFIAPSINALEADAVSPQSGHVDSTEFTFSIDNTPSANQDAYLSIYAPDTDNQWAWREYLMTGTSMSLKLASLSDQYQYQYLLKDSVSDSVIDSSEIYNGPILTVDGTDERSPQVLRSAPGNGHNQVPVDTQLTLHFDESIAPSSVSASDFTLSGTSNQISTITAYQNRVIVSFTQPFEQTTGFDTNTISVSVSGISDLNGNTMAPYTTAFEIEPPLVSLFKIENRKYDNHCLTVIDQKKRFAAPEEWNPIVELTACKDGNENIEQRWFMSSAPQTGNYGQIHWAANHHFCLSKNAASDPKLVACDIQADAQNFKANARKDYFLLESEAGGCLASGVVDVGGINKVESSLCLKTLSRNHWYIADQGLVELTEPLLLGQVDVRFADIQYDNPLANIDLDTEQTRALVKALMETEAVNADEMYAQLNLQTSDVLGEGFITANPYFPKYYGTEIPLPKVRSVVRDGVEIINPEDYENTQEGYHYTDEGIEYYSQEVVARWYSDVTHAQAAADQVCAVRFINDTQYELKTFSSRLDALSEGYSVTHQYKCGTCSSLQDLAVYMGVPDLTTPVRLCTKRGRAKDSNLDQVKNCLIETVGFSEMCAETWAYNGIHTGQECQQICLRAYGNDALLWPAFNGFIDMVIFEKFNACPTDVETDDPVLRQQMLESGCPLANEVTGKLNDCLWCDERRSGPGFKYAAGRTRRASGLESAIPRPNDRVYYEADHTQYFK